MLYNAVCNAVCIKTRLMSSNDSQQYYQKKIYIEKNNKAHDMTSNICSANIQNNPIATAQQLIPGDSDRQRRWIDTTRTR